MADTVALRLQANLGDPKAQTALAFAMLTDRRGPSETAAAVQLLNAAAAQKNTDALLLLAVLAAVGIGRSRKLDDAYRYVKEAAALGDKGALGQLSVLGRDELDKAPWTKPIHLIQQSESPRIFMVEDFIPKFVCDYLIKIADKRRRPSTIYDAASATLIADPARTSESAEFRALEPDLPTHLVSRRIASAVGLPILNHEGTSILRYARGQEYRPHFDFIRPGAESEAFAAELAVYGQRVATALIYLNDDYEGGETAFPLIDKRFRGKAGDALIFWNVTEAGELDRLTWHAGTPVTKGEKWLLSKWIREKALPLF